MGLLLVSNILFNIFTDFKSGAMVILLKKRKEEKLVGILIYSSIIKLLVL